MEEETFFDKVGAWKIELYHMPRREAYKVGVFWDDECTVDEAYETFTEMFGSVPPHAVVEHASALPEGEPMRYEVRLYGGVSPAALCIITWPHAAVETCVADYKARTVVKKVVILEVEVSEELGDDPNEWDWSEIVETGNFAVLDSSTEVC